MEDQSKQDPFSENNLESPEYRERLTRKLNCLVALLEVAISRVHQTLSGPDPDVERLERVRTNLQSTLGVCLRARVALEEQRALPGDLPQVLGRITFDAHHEGGEVPQEPLPPGAFVELSSSNEHAKFQKRGPISVREIHETDLEDLERRLMGS